MVHNGIEYALMGAYAEGFNILAHANAARTPRSADAETAPLRHPEHYQYDLPLPEIAELWRRGSVIGSWLLDLTARALAEHPDLTPFSGHVSDSGEGRWTAAAAIETSAPAPILTAALFQRFSSRGEDDFANRLLSAMRHQFGGHVERAGEARSNRGPMSTLGRAGPVRRDRRPRLPADLSRAACDGPARPSRRAGHRRRAAADGR